MDVEIITQATTRAELAEISALAEIVWRDHYPGIISLAQIDYMLGMMYGAEVLDREVRREGIAFDCLRRGDRLVGFASYGPSGRPGEMKLHKLYFHPAEQRKGYGSRLLAHVGRVARDRGFHTLILAVNKRNYGAIRAYERNDFIVREEIVADIGGGFVMDDYVMAKNLDPPAR